MMYRWIFVKKSKENAYTTIKMSELKYIAGGGLVVVNW
jgi:hypothetical protein